MFSLNSEILQNFWLQTETFMDRTCSRYWAWKNILNICQKIWKKNAR